MLELGSSCATDEHARAAAGMNVLISKFSGVIVKGPLDGKIYRLCNEEDIFCELVGDLSKMMLKDPIAESKRQGGEAKDKADDLKERP